MKKELIIQLIIDKINAVTYLEIGVQRGKNFFAVKAPKKIAIDPNFMLGIQRTISHLIDYWRSNFFEMTSDDFFRTKAAGFFGKTKIDVAFIDGLHTYENSLADFENCLNYLSPNGIILFHDCNPASREAAEYAHSPQEIQQRFPGRNAEWNGDVWKTIVHIRSLYPDLEVCVLDCDFGVGIARRKKPSDPLSFSRDQITALTYADLEKNRDRFLNLKSPDYLRDLITSL